MTRLAFLTSLLCVLAACMVQGSNTTPAPAAGGSADGSCVDSDDVPGDLVAAAPTEPGALTGCFGSGDDVDMFALFTPADGGGTLYRIEVAGPATLWPCATVFDAQQQEHSAICADKEGGVAAGWIHAAPGTTVLLKVHPFVGFVGSMGYSVRIDASPLADADEPNDSPDQATPLALGTPHEGFLGAAVNAPSMTLDHYRFELVADGAVAIALERPDPREHWYLRVLDAAGQEVHNASARREGLAIDTSVELTKGSYVVEVGLFVGELTTADKGSLPARLTTPYTITVTPK